MLITLRDIFTHNTGKIVPLEPVSLYRYIEHLVEVTAARKFKLKRMLEIGPGIYPALKHFYANEFKSVTLVDYNERVLDFCEKVIAPARAESIVTDIEQPDALTKLGRSWDFVVSNGVVEHIKNDREHVRDIHNVLEPGGIFACVTVLHPSLFNDWDRAVGHYRRYTVPQFREMLGDFSEVQIIQTAMLQEIVRPLFFCRIRHLLKNSTEVNNRLFGDEVGNFSKPPYASIFGVVRYLLPAYLLCDWTKSGLWGGIVVVLARK